MVFSQDGRQVEIYAVRIINRKRYSTETAELLAHDSYHDGHNWTRHGRNCWLFKTPRGRYFQVVTSLWEDEPEVSLKPLSEEEAAECFEQLPVHEVVWEAAFPHMPLEEA